MADNWPATAGDDLTKLIGQLRAIGKPAGAEKSDKTTLARTPYSLQDIKSGASALTKVWAMAVAAAGGVPALLAVGKGIANRLGADSDDGLVRAAFVLSGSILLSVVALSIALIVRGDVSARAAAHSARATAEANIISTALAHYRFAQPTGWLVQKNDGTILPILKFNWAGQPDKKQLIVTTTTGDELVEGDWQSIINAADLKPDA